MKKSTVISIHLVFWAVFFITRFIMTPITVQYFELDPTDYGKMNMITNCLMPVFFYIGYLIIMKFQENRKFLYFSLLEMVIIYLIVFAVSSKTFGLMLVPIPSFFLWATIGALFRFFVDWFKKKNDMLVLEKENITSNLDLLKNQINPHFLFNTLHNIDALIHEDQDKASKSLVKLSDIMRYMLKDTKTDFVELKNEIEYIENYFSLESLRLKNEKFFNYSISGNYDRLKIAPMMLIPFVENAFKHAVDSGTENGIIIKIAIENKKLFFTCENQYYKSEADNDYSHGIGLETVKQRLDLIYKSKHKLDIHSDDSVFKVNLELELNEN